jgi:hypothetical protein
MVCDDEAAALNVHAAGAVPIQQAPPFAGVILA